MLSTARAACDCAIGDLTSLITNLGMLGMAELESNCPIRQQRHAYGRLPTVLYLYLPMLQDSPRRHRRADRSRLVDVFVRSVITSVRNLAG